MFGAANRWSEFTEDYLQTNTEIALRYLGVWYS